MMQLAPTTLPAIRLTLGDDLETIQRQSTYRFPPRQLSGTGVIAAGEPVIFEYARPGCGFRLPPARSFGASVDEAQAVSIIVSPQLRYIQLTDALGLIDYINRLLERSSWSLSKRYPTADQVPSRGKQYEANHLEIRVADWRCGDDELYIELARRRQREDGLNYDLCLVSVKIVNERLRAK
ncbi:MAG: hypothetical protein ABJF23_16330 [Bryobacteraceae bacterium]